MAYKSKDEHRPLGSSPGCLLTQVNWALHWESFTDTCKYQCRAHFLWLHRRIPGLAAPPSLLRAVQAEGTHCGLVESVWETCVLDAILSHSLPFVRAFISLLEKSEGWIGWSLRTPPSTLWCPWVPILAPIYLEVCLCSRWGLEIGFISSTKSN